MRTIKITAAVLIMLTVFAVTFFFSSTAFVKNLNIDYPGKSDFLHPSKMLVRWESFVAGIVMKPAYRQFVGDMHLEGSEDILDFGSGAGGEAMFLAEAIRDKKGTLTCLDISRSWLEVVKWRLAGHKNISFLLGDITALDIPARSHDIIAVRLVLHDIDPAQRKDVIAAFRKVLRPGGAVHILEPLGTDHSIDENDLRSLFKKGGFRERLFEKNFSFVMLPPRTMGRGVYIRE